MTVPAVQQLGAAVILQGAALIDARRFVALGIRAAWQDGIAAPPRVALLQQALTDAAAEVRAASALGHGDVAQLPTRAVSDPSEPLTTREVAAMLGIGVRQAQRMAGTLDARQLRCGRLLFNRGAVDAYLADHHSRKAATQ